MAQWQGRSKRKRSGGRIRLHRKKRTFEIGREKQFTTIGEYKNLKIRTRGHNHKMRLIHSELANVTDPKTKKTKRTKILTVLENNANPFYVRRNIINKGAVIETELGNAKVTSRPGQQGIINAILISK
ncbi:30S ribosomal protein S8e [[Eubacterium] cellulosolvens]